MNPTDRKKWEALALERLNATADDDEQWSFLFRTEGAENVTYCPWSQTQDWEFDGTVDGLDLPWSEARRALIESGEADPTEEELRQWREAMCRGLVDSDQSWIAHVVPLWIDKTIAAYAVFATDGTSDPGEPPAFKGVFDRIDEARAAIAADGVVADVA